MQDALDKTPLPEDTLASLAKPEIITGLSESNQKAVIDSIANSKDKDGGWMGKFFGNKKENAAMNISFTVCILLSLIGIICMVLGHDYWNVILPAITSAVGYMFGVGAKK